MLCWYATGQIFILLVHTVHTSGHSWKPSPFIKHSHVLQYLSQRAPQVNTSKQERNATQHLLHISFAIYSTSLQYFCIANRVTPRECI